MGCFVCTYLHVGNCKVQNLIRELEPRRKDETLQRRLQGAVQGSMRTPLGGSIADVGDALPMPYSMTDTGNATSTMLAWPALGVPSFCILSPLESRVWTSGNASAYANALQ